MIKYSLLLFVVLALFIAGCTPAINNSGLNTNEASADDEVMKDKDGAAMEDKDDEVMTDTKYQTYENKAVNYQVDIPTNWFWRHYTRAQIGDASPGVDDYLFISPTHAITGFQTEAPAEITVEISSRDINNFMDSSMTKSSVTVAGQAATKYSGVINNEVLSNHQKIEYQLVYKGKTVRLIYLASAELDQYEKIFEEIVKSFKFE